MRGFKSNSQLVRTVKVPYDVKKSAPPLAPARLPTLDGLRGCAIVCVMLHHVAQYGRLSGQGAVANIVAVTARAGWAGVDLFFVLSGFLITGILCDAKDGQHYFGHFYARRCLRIFPLYLAMLSFYFLALPIACRLGQWHCELPTDQLWYWTYTTNIKFAVDGWPDVSALAHFWSLALEEQYYLVWPVLVFLLPPRALMGVCGISIVGAFFVRRGFASRGFPIAAYTLLPARIDTLAIGALLALLAREPGGLNSWRRTAWLVAATSGTALAVIAGWRKGLWTQDWVVYTIGYTLLAWFFGSLLTLAVTAPQGSSLAQVFSSRTLRYFGRYSYGLYVFHHPIVILIGRSMFTIADMPLIAGSPLPAFALYSVLIGGLSFAAALASWHLLEFPFLRLKEKFPYSRNVSIVAVSEG